MSVRVLKAASHGHMSDFPSLQSTLLKLQEPNLRFSSCGRVSMGTPGKEMKGTVSEMRLGGTSFLMSGVLDLKILCYTLIVPLK